MKLDPEMVRKVCRDTGLTEAEVECYQERLLKTFGVAVDAAKRSTPPDIYEARTRGKEYCRTEGSDHYIQPGPEAMDLIIACGYAEGFCLGDIIKYAVRYGETGNPGELKKIADMAHILCGVELGAAKKEGAVNE
jgi:hypothetical protein